MPSKRKYFFDNDSESSGDDDFLPSDDETPETHQRKRARHREDSPAAPSKKAQRRSSTITKSHRRATARKKAAEDTLARRLEAEVADLVDFNAPPKARIEDSSDEDGPPVPRRTRKRKDTKPHEMGKPQKRRKITAPLPKPKPRQSRTKDLQDEIAELTPWVYWQADSEEETDDLSDTKGHKESGRHPPASTYPPIKAGVQNTPWSSLPAEIRNEIYKCCMAKEEEKAVNVLHYPEGIPRRSIRGRSSSTNFSLSYWGFTQTCTGVRKEFTPWLLGKRSVRTPLATLNNYVDTFHPRDPVTGQRYGKIEPFCNEGPLPEEGVEILELIREKDRSPEFHLQLTPTIVQPTLPDAPTVIDLTSYDELDVLKKVDQYRQHAMNFTSIRITSIPRPRTNVDVRSHSILLKLKYEALAFVHPAFDMRGEQIRMMNMFIYNTRLSEEEDLHFEASVAGGIGKWRVRHLDMLAVTWKRKSRRGKKLYWTTILHEPLDGSRPYYTTIDLN